MPPPGAGLALAPQAAQRRPFARPNLVAISFRIFFRRSHRSPAAPTRRRIFKPIRQSDVSTPHFFKKHSAAKPLLSSNLGVSAATRHLHVIRMLLARAAPVSVPLGATWRGRRHVSDTSATRRRER
jgi:hypothetical protein